MSIKLRILICYASISIRYRPEHDLYAKLSVISNAGFDAIKLSISDRLSSISNQFDKEVNRKDYGSLYTAGQEVKKICEEHALKNLGTVAISQL